MFTILVWAYIQQVMYVRFFMRFQRFALSHENLKTPKYHPFNTCMIIGVIVPF